jgi:DNA-binding LacI/PurR family transcriptional regulator
MTGGTKLSLKDVAQRAGVSLASVSRVARGQTNVDTAIRDRVRQAAGELGVDLDLKHRNGASMVGFILGNRDVLHSFQARILLGAERYCSSQNVDLVFLSLRYSPATPSRELHIPQILTQPSPVRAVILGGTNSANMIGALRERKIPFAVLGNNVVGPWEPSEHDCVYSDDMQGAFDLTSQLIADGHRRIWFIGDTDLPWFARCGEGYRQAMEKSGLQTRFSEIRSDDVQLGYLAMRSILSRREPVTAVFAASDQIARGVYEALRNSGVSIPRDISVAGFNDTEAGLMHPTLTTVREYPEELGQHLAEFVLRRMKEPGREAQQLVIPTRVVVGDSTAACSVAAPSGLPMASSLANGQEI